MLRTRPDATIDKSEFKNYTLSLTIYQIEWLKKHKNVSGLIRNLIDEAIKKEEAASPAVQGEAPQLTPIEETLVRALTDYGEAWCDGQEEDEFEVPHRYTKIPPFKNWVEGPSWTADFNSFNQLLTNKHKELGAYLEELRKKKTIGEELERVITEAATRWRNNYPELYKVKIVPGTSLGELILWIKRRRLEPLRVNAIAKELGLSYDVTYRRVVPLLRGEGIIFGAETRKRDEESGE